MKRLFDAPCSIPTPICASPPSTIATSSRSQARPLYEIAYARLRDDCYLPVLAGERKSREALLGA